MSVVKHDTGARSFRGSGDSNMGCPFERLADRFARARVPTADGLVGASRDDHRRAVDCAPQTAFVSNARRDASARGSGANIAKASLLRSAISSITFSAMKKA
jgi:hypothetical protein